MTVHLRIELKEELEEQDTGNGLVDDTRPPVERIPPIVVSLIDQVTLGRGEEKTIHSRSASTASDAAFNRQMKALKNPHVDLEPFYAHERGVSRRHARITLHSTRMTVADLGSTNGTYVNNEKLDANVEYPIKTGDELRLGFLSLTITVL